MQNDLPRDKYHVYRNAPQKPIFIRAQYALSGEEQAELAGIIQCDTVSVPEIVVSRDFDGNYTYEFLHEPAHEDEDDTFVSIEGVTDYVDAFGKTVASADLRAAERLKGKNQPQSIYPAHATLGLSVSDTLLINCNPILVEGESDQLYLSALKKLLISKGKISPLKEIVFIPTGGVKGIKATSAILSGVNEVKPPVLIDGDKPAVKIFNELKADFYAVDTDKLIMVTDFSAVPEAEVEDLLPKAKLAKVITRFLPRPEDTDKEFDDIVVDNKPICNQIEEFAKTRGIDLGKGWKVRLVAMVKREILKGTDKVICETAPEFAKILELFNCFS